MKLPASRCRSARSSCWCSPCSWRCRGSASSTCASWSACCATRRSARSPAPRRRWRPRCTTGRGCSRLPPDPIASFARERADDRAHAGGSLPPSASPEIAQIIEGLSRTTARIWVDRPRRHRARARRLAQAAAAAGAARIVLGARRARDRSAGSTRWCSTSRPRTSATTPPRAARRAAATSRARSPASSRPTGGRRPTARR